MPLFNIGFEFNSETNSVSNISVKEVAKMVEKAKAKAAETVNVPVAVSLVGSTLQLTQGVVDLLNVEVGDKIALVNTNGSFTLVAGSKGNVLSKKLTITCKGKIQEELKDSLGEKYDAHKVNEGVVGLGSLGSEVDKDIPVTVSDDEIDDTLVEQLGDSLDDFDFDFEL
jgi:hypothetical protein